MLAMTEKLLFGQSLSIPMSLTDCQWVNFVDFSRFCNGSTEPVLSEVEVLTMTKNYFLDRLDSLAISKRTH
jgi:hypothetical protein